MPQSAPPLLTLNAVCISGFGGQTEGGVVELEEEVNEELDKRMDETEEQHDLDEA